MNMKVTLLMPSMIMVLIANDLDAKLLPAVHEKPTIRAESTYGLALQAG